MNEKINEKDEGFNENVDATDCYLSGDSEKEWLLNMANLSGLKKEVEEMIRGMDKNDSELLGTIETPKYILEHLASDYLDMIKDEIYGVECTEDKEICFGWCERYPDYIFMFFGGVVIGMDKEALESFCRLIDRAYMNQMR